MKFSREEKQNLLNPSKNKSFCMFPWSHLYIEPTGDTMPCCNVNKDTQYATTKTNTLDEIINSEVWNNLRLDMLNGKQSEICTKCYEVEQSGTPSYRGFANAEFGKFIDLIDNTTDTGELTEFALKYIDVRFSNLCNFGCASCGAEFSTTWIDMHKTLFTISEDNYAYRYNKVYDNSKEDIILQLSKHLKTAHQIYFAGGEPLIMDEHYAMLQLLDREHITDVMLRYNTNLSILNYKHRHVTEYWKKFKTVEVGASIDAVGPLAEVIRKGTVWTDIEQNIKSLLPYDNIRLNYDVTVSNMNVNQLPELYDYIIGHNLVQERSWFTTNLLFDPSAFSITSLPDDIKEKITNKLLTWVDQFQNNPPASDLSLSAIIDIGNRLRGVVSFMNSKNTWNHEAFKFQLDHTLWYTEEWKTIIPYFNELYYRDEK